MLEFTTALGGKDAGGGGGMESYNHKNAVSGLLSS